MTDAEDDAEIVRREREWLLVRLRQSAAEQAYLDARRRDLVRSARIAGAGWDEIAEALGMTAEAALEKYGEPPPGEAPF